MPLSPTLKRLIPPIVSLALFMEAVDTTIINTAIPVMAKSLSVNAIDLKIALISYLLSLAIFVPISGWLSDKVGIKRLFILALTLFTLSSFACGLSTNLTELVIARCVQGIGGAFMMPLGRLMIVRWYDRTELVQTMNRVIMLALTGPALGPLLGGWITQTFSWRWIFWVNIPFGIVNIIAAWWILPEYRNKDVHRLDVLGFLLFGFGLAGFTFSLSALSEHAINLSIVVIVFTLSLVLLASYVWHSRKLPNPVLKTALFKIPTFRISVIGNLTSRLGFGATLFLLPLMLQLSLHYSPLESGLMVAFLALGSFLIKTFSKQLIGMFGFKRTLLLNSVILGASLFLFSTVGVTTSMVIIALYTTFFGFISALQYSGMNPLAFSDMDQTELSNATSIHTTNMQLSQSMSVAICALILTRMNMNFHATFVVMGCMTILAGSVFLFLDKRAGESLL